MPYTLLELEPGKDRLRKVGKGGRIGAPVKCLWNDVKGYVKANHAALKELQIFKAQQEGPVRSKVKDAFDVAAPDANHWMQLLYKGNHVYMLVTTGKTAKLTEAVAVVHFKEERERRVSPDKWVGTHESTLSDDPRAQLLRRLEAMTKWMARVHRASGPGLADKTTQIGVLRQAFVDLGGSAAQVTTLNGYDATVTAHRDLLLLRQSILRVETAPQAFAAAMWLSQTLQAVGPEPTLLDRRQYAQVAGMTGWLLGRATTACEAILADNWTRPEVVARAQSSFDLARVARTQLDDPFPAGLIAALKTIQKRLRVSAGKLSDAWTGLYGDDKLTIGNLGAARALLAAVEIAAADIVNDEEKAATAEFVKAARAAIDAIVKTLEVSDEVETALTDELALIIQDDTAPELQWRTDVQLGLDGATYDQGDVLGAGAEGKVVKYESTTGRPPLAVKFADVFVIEHERKMFDTVGHHPNIVRCLGTAAFGGDTGLVLQACEGGDLDGVMDRALHGLKQDPMPPGLSKEVYWGGMQHVFRGVVRALAHLESVGLGHDDLKGANVVIDLNDGEPRITDFGSMSPLGSGTMHGTPGYLDSGTKVGPQRDGFSLGSMAYRAEFGSPFDYGSGKGVPQDVFGVANLIADYIAAGKKALPLLGKRSKAYVDFTNALLNATRSDRPGYLKLLQMPFLADSLLDEAEAKAAVRLLGRLPPVPAPPAAPQPAHGGGVQGGGGVPVDPVVMPTADSLGITQSQLDRFTTAVQQEQESVVKLADVFKTLMPALKAAGSAPKISAIGFTIQCIFADSELLEEHLTDAFPGKNVSGIVDRNENAEEINVGDLADLV